jgi:L-gulonolactone oxidase
LHGTAPAQGYLSEQLVWVKIIDARGTIHKLERGKDDDELFAVTGAIGALGVVIELELQCVPKYRLEKKITIVERRIVHDNIQSFLGYNDHLSFYYIGGTTIESCRMNTWNVTVADESFLCHARHFLQEIFDFILCGFILGIGRFTQQLDAFGPFGMLIMKFFMNRSLTAYSAASFSRQLFYRHDEIEYGIPREKFNEVVEELLELLKSNHDFVTIIEIRFAGTSHSLLGPGSSRDTVFFELAPSLSVDPTPMFTLVERLFKRHGGKPHLGKWTTATPAYMREVHGENFTKFNEIRRRFDPQGKFSNEFVNQVFGPPGPAPLISSTSPHSYPGPSLRSFEINENDED